MGIDVRQEGLINNQWSNSYQKCFSIQIFSSQLCAPTLVATDRERPKYRCDGQLAAYICPYSIYKKESISLSGLELVVLHPLQS